MSKHYLQYKNTIFHRLYEMEKWIERNLQGAYVIDNELESQLKEYKRVVEGSTTDFMMFVDVMKFQIFETCNYLKILGYEEKNLTIDQHALRIFEPENQVYFHTGINFWIVLREYVERGNKIVPFRFHLSLRYPVVHKNGTLLDVLLRIIPIQLNDKGFMIKYMNHYTVIREYKNREERDGNLSCQIVDNNMKRLTDLETRIYQLNKIFIPNPFTKRQLEILRVITTSNYDISITDIAKKIGIRRDTLNKSIYKGSGCLYARANKYANREFKDVYDVALFFSNLGIV